MHLNEYQEAACGTCISRSFDHLGFGLVEEAGEVAAIMKRFHRGDEEYSTASTWTTEHPLLTGAAYDKLKAELGDVLWHVAAFADALGFSLDDVARDNLQKVQRRNANNTVMGSGDDR